MESKRDTIYNNCVTCIGATIETNNNVMSGSQKIDHPALPFVSPTQTYQNRYRHLITPLGNWLSQPQIRRLISLATATPQAEACIKPRVIPAPSPCLLYTS